jgi:predicted dehydrogenase
VNNPSRRAGDQLAGGRETAVSQSSISKPRNVSVLLVGAGRRGLTALVPALRASKPMHLAAIVETPERIAELRGMPDLEVPLYDSIDSALAAFAPDLAVVATPHDSHVPLTARLLGGQIPTLLEKPPARNRVEFSELIRASEDNLTPLTTVLTLHYQTRFNDFARTLRSPALTDAKVFITADVPSWPGIGRWRQSRVRAGGGVLMDLGYHYVELIVACLGLPDQLAVKLRAKSASDEVEDQAHASLYFAARRITVDIGLKSGADFSRHSEVLIVRDGEPVFASASDPGRRPSEHPSGAALPRAVMAQLAALLSTGFLAGDGPWRDTLARQLSVLSLLDRMYAGAEYQAEISERVLV